MCHQLKCQGPEMKKKKGECKKMNALMSREIRSWKGVYRFVTELRIVKYIIYNFVHFYFAVFCN